MFFMQTVLKIDYATVYWIVVAALGVVVSLVWIREPTHRVKIWDEVGGAPPLIADQP